MPTCSGVVSLGFTAYGALRRFDPERMARLALGGTALGGIFGIVVIVVALLLDVL